jgi:hypothetical protein
MLLIVANYVCHAARLQRHTGSAGTSLDQNGEFICLKKWSELSEMARTLIAIFRGKSLSRSTLATYTELSHSSHATYASYASYTSHANQASHARHASHA